MGSKGAPFSGFALTSHDGLISESYRTAGFVSSFCVESMAVLAALELIDRQRWPRTVIFSDFQSVLGAVGAP